MKCVNRGWADKAPAGRAEGVGGRRCRWGGRTRARLRRQAGAWTLAGVLGLAGALASRAQEVDPVVRGLWPGYLGGSIRAVAVANGLAYCALWYGGLLVVDVADPARARVVGSAEGAYIEGRSGSISVSGSVVCLATRQDGLWIYDVSDPARPRHVGTYYVTSHSPTSVVAEGNYAYVAYRERSVSILDISDPTDPRLVASLAAPGAKVVVKSGDYLYLIGPLYVVDVRNPTRPRIVATLDYDILGGRSPGQLAVANGRAYVSYSAGDTIIPMPTYQGVLTVDVQTPSAPRLVGDYIISTNSSITGLAAAADGKVVFVHEYQRGLLALDFTRTNRPVVLGSYQPVGNSGFASVFGHPMFLQGGVLYWAQGVLEMIDVRNPARPAFAGLLNVRFQETSHVAVRAGYAWVLDGANGLQVVDVRQPDTPTLVGANPDCRGSRLRLAGPYAYVAGGSSGLEVLAADDPTQPRHVGQLAEPVASGDVAVVGQYAYLTHESQGLVVVEVSDPARPQQVGASTSLRGAADVEAAGRYAYVWYAGSGIAPGVAVFDLQNPLAPSLVADVKNFKNSDSSVTGRRLFLADHYLYVLGGTNFSAVTILDVSDPARPRWVGSRNVDPHFPTHLSGSDRFVLVGDDDQGVFVLDRSQPTELRRVGWFGIARRPVAVTLEDGMAYVAAGEAGLVIVDLNQRAALQRSASAPTLTRAVAVAALGSQAILGTEGYWPYEPATLNVFETAGPGPPRLLGQTSLSSDDVAVAGQYAYVARSVNGWAVVDLSVPARPTTVWSVDDDTVFPGSLAVQGDWLVLVGTRPGRGYGSLRVYDVSVPTSPELLGAFEPETALDQAVVAGSVAFAAAGASGWWAVDLSDPRAPKPLGLQATGGSVVRLCLAGTNLVVADTVQGILIYGVADPRNPKRLGRYPAVGSVVADDRYLYIGRGYQGLEVVDLSDPAQPRRVGWSSGFAANDLALTADKLFVAAGSEGLVVLERFRPPTRLGVPLWREDGVVELRVEGVQGTRVRVQRSENLRDWSDWESVTVEAGGSVVREIGGGLSPRRFYRVVAP